MLAPIALFIYNRPEHTKKCLHALKGNELSANSVLYIFADGPKENAGAYELSRIDETRKIAKSEKWCGQVVFIEKEKNAGLADSIISGVTEIVKKHGKIIVLEDDVIPLPGFLKYMNEALEIYAADNKVMQVSGYIYPHKVHTPQTSVFLKIMACWGWGTWARAWKFYEHDADTHLEYWISKKRIKKFDIEGGAYFHDQLLANKSGSIYTWAVKWYASWLAAGGISLFPSKSLVQNIGMDNSGVHCIEMDVFNGEISSSLEIKKETIREDMALRKDIDTFFREKVTGKKRLSVPGRFYAGVKSFLRLFYHSVKTKTGDVSANSGQHNAQISAKAKLYPPYSVSDTSIGDYTYVAVNSAISLSQIGKFCSIGPNFFCGYGIHPLNGISTSPMFYSTLKQNGFSLTEKDKIQERKKIVIGNDVFIGANVTILDGVTIADGAVIGAGAVVVNDIPPYAVAGGVPAKIIKYRFSDDIINRLLQLKWWNWDEEKLKRIEADFFDIDLFLNKIK